MAAVVATPSCIDRVNTLLERTGRDPLFEQDFDKITLDGVFEFVDRTRRDEAFLWINTSGYFSQHLMILIPTMMSVGHSLTHAGIEAVAAISFALLALVGLVETVARLILALVIMPFAHLASCCGLIDGKTYNFLHAITLIGSVYSLTGTALSIFISVSNLVSCPFTLFSALCGSQTPQESANRNASVI